MERNPSNEVRFLRVRRGFRQRVCALSQSVEVTTGDPRVRNARRRADGRTRFAPSVAREGWANRRSALAPPARPAMLPAKNLIVASGLDSPDDKSTSAPLRPRSLLPDRTASGRAPACARTWIAGRDRLDVRGLRCRRNRAERGGLHARFRGRHLCESESCVSEMQRNPSNEARFLHVRRGLRQRVCALSLSVEVTPGDSRVRNVRRRAIAVS